MHGAVTAGAGAGWCHIQPRVHCSYLSTPIIKRISENLKSSTNLIQFNLCLGLVWEWWMLAAAASCILEAWYFFISAGLDWAGRGGVDWLDSDSCSWSQLTDCWPPHLPHPQVSATTSRHSGLLLVESTAYALTPPKNLLCWTGINKQMVRPPKIRTLVRNMHHRK